MPILDYDIVRFTEGDCHILAKRLHRVAGLPLYAFQGLGGFPDLHVFVMHDGKPLDVEGHHDMKNFLKFWKTSIAPKIMPIELKDLSEWPLEYGHYSYARARIVADILLDEFVR